MEIISGTALKDGVIFETETTRAISRRLKNDQIDISVEKKLITNTPIVRLLKTIPFLRGIVLFLRIILSSKTFTAIVLLNLLLDFLSFLMPTEVQTSNVSAVFNVAIILVGLLIIIIFLVATFRSMVNIKNIFRYHGAEHMVYNTLEKAKELTLDNVRKESRAVKTCGTNYLIIFISVFLLLFLFLKGVPFKLIFILTWSISFEIFYNIETKFFKTLFWLGGLAQQYFFTLKPTDNELEVAIAAANALIDIKLTT